MAETLSPIAIMSMSLQSTDEKVLKFVGRNNIRIDKYDSIRQEATKRGIQTFCELIYGLPGESYDTFLK
jgi:putative methyltransferase